MLAIAPRRFLQVVWLVSCLLAIGSATAQARGASGFLDPEFGDGGHATAGIGLPEHASWLEMPVLSARSPGGDLFLATEGQRGSPVIVDFTAAGAIRRSFAENGRLRVRLTSGAPFALGAITVDAQGDLLVAGESAYREFGNSEFPSGGAGFVMYRFQPDGAPDLSFGPGGAGYVQRTVLTAFPGAAPRTTDGVSGIAVDPSGRIVVAGDANTGDGYCGDIRSSFLARFDPDGQVDSGFGTDGAIVFPLAKMAGGFGMALDSEGAPVVFGRDLSCRPPEPTSWLVRLTSAGAPDPGFGSEGWIGTGSLLAIAVDESGRVLTLNSAGRVSRYSASGTLDPGFRRNGTRAMPKGWKPGGMAITESGRVLVTGTEVLGHRYRLVLTEIAPTGAVVRSFGDGGVVGGGLGGRSQATGQQVFADSSGHALVAAKVSTRAVPAGLAWFRFTLGR